ncbi:hypothetical protein BGZ94_007188 [Podila epigama]|nr:hypothetical protein BGZ94_007188 [Podila epigama]
MATHGKRSMWPEDLEHRAQRPQEIDQIQQRKRLKIGTGCDPFSTQAVNAIDSMFDRVISIASSHIPSLAKARRPHLATARSNDQKPQGYDTIASPSSSLPHNPWRPLTAADKEAKLDEVGPGYRKSTWATLASHPQKTTQTLETLSKPLGRAPATALLKTAGEASVVQDADGADSDSDVMEILSSDGEEASSFRSEGEEQYSDEEDEHDESEEESYESEEDVDADADADAQSDSVQYNDDDPMDRNQPIPLFDSDDDAQEDHTQPDLESTERQEYDSANEYEEEERDKDGKFYDDFEYAEEKEEEFEEEEVGEEEVEEDDVEEEEVDDEEVEDEEEIEEDERDHYIGSSSASRQVSFGEISSDEDAVEEREQSQEHMDVKEQDEDQDFDERHESIRGSQFRRSPDTTPIPLENNAEEEQEERSDVDEESEIRAADISLHKDDTYNEDEDGIYDDEHREDDAGEDDEDAEELANIDQQREALDSEHAILLESDDEAEDMPFEAEFESPGPMSGSQEYEEDPRNYDNGIDHEGHVEDQEDQEDQNREEAAENVMYEDQDDGEDERARQEEMAVDDQATETQREQERVLDAFQLVKEAGDDGEESVMEYDARQDEAPLVEVSVHVTAVETSGSAPDAKAGMDEISLTAMQGLTEVDMDAHMSDMTFGDPAQILADLEAMHNQSSLPEQPIVSHDMDHVNLLANILTVHRESDAHPSAHDAEAVSIDIVQQTVVAETWQHSVEDDTRQFDDLLPHSESIQRKDDESVYIQDETRNESSAQEEEQEQTEVQQDELPQNESILEQHMQVDKVETSHEVSGNHQDDENDISKPLRSVAEATAEAAIEETQQSQDKLDSEKAETQEDPQKASLPPQGDVSLLPESPAAVTSEEITRETSTTPQEPLVESRASPRKARLQRSGTMDVTAREGPANSAPAMMSRLTSMTEMDDQAMEQTPEGEKSSSSPKFLPNADFELEAPSLPSGRGRSEVDLLVKEAREFCARAPPSRTGSSPVSAGGSIGDHSMVTMPVMAPFSEVPTLFGTTGMSSGPTGLNLERRRSSVEMSQDQRSETASPRSTTSSTMRLPPTPTIGVVDLAEEKVIQSTMVGSHALRKFIHTPLPKGGSPSTHGSTGHGAGPTHSRSTSLEPNISPRCSLHYQQQQQQQQQQSLGSGGNMFTFGFGQTPLGVNLGTPPAPPVFGSQGGISPSRSVGFGFGSSISPSSNWSKDFSGDGAMPLHGGNPLSSSFSSTSTAKEMALSSISEDDHSTSEAKESNGTMAVAANENMENENETDKDESEQGEESAWNSEVETEGVVEVVAEDGASTASPSLALSEPRVLNKSKKKKKFGRSQKKNKTRR